jgi:hypothetical protein
MAAKRGGAGGEATIDMIAIYELDGRHPPNTPPRFPFLSPGLPGRGLSFAARRSPPFGPTTVRKRTGL